VDIYDIDDKYYRKNAEDFEKGKLEAQQLNLENLAIARADVFIFRFLPIESIDFVLFVSPSGYLNDALLFEELYESIKVGGKILIKPWYNFDKSYAYGNPPETIFYAPREISYKGRSFINTNSSIAFGVDVDKVSNSPSDRPVFEWQKKRKSEEGKAAMLDLSALTPREHDLLNQALESFFNKSQDIGVLTDKELIHIDPHSDLRRIKGLKVYTFTRQQLRKALQHNTTAKKREVDYIVDNLISHPGRFRTEEGKPRATNLFIPKEYYKAISELDENLKALWAAHERKHLENIALVESDVGEMRPLYNVIKALEKKVSRKTKFTNKLGLKQVMRLIIARVKDKKKPLLIGIDGDSRTGKTVLSDDVALLLPADIRYKIIHIDNYHVLEGGAHLSGDLTAYIDQFGSSGGMMLEREYWDYGSAGDEVNLSVNSGQFDVIILEGLNYLYVEKLNYLGPVKPRFDIKIHLIADQETREYIYMKRFTSEAALLNMKDYLNNYVQKYPAESVNYDIIIDNSFSSVDMLDITDIQKATKPGSCL